MTENKEEESIITDVNTIDFSNSEKTWIPVKALSYFTEMEKEGSLILLMTENKNQFIVVREIAWDFNGKPTHYHVILTGKSKNLYDPFTIRIDEFKMFLETFSVFGELKILMEYCAKIIKECQNADITELLKEYRSGELK